MTPFVSGGKRGFSPERGERPADSFWQQLGGAALIARSAFDTVDWSNATFHSIHMGDTHFPLGARPLPILLIFVALLVVLDLVLVRWLKLGKVARYG